MGHIQRKHLSEALVVVPTKEVLEWMNKTFSPILNRQIQGDLNPERLRRSEMPSSPVSSLAN